MNEHSDRRVTSASFEDWVRLVFDHPGEGPEWYHGDAAAWWAGPPVVTLDYITRILAEPLPTLEAYDDAQLNRGLWYLLGATGDNHCEVLGDPRLPVSDRIACLRAMLPFFRDLLADRCAPVLSHLDEPGAGPLNSACYMWWDVITFFAAPDRPERREVDQAALAVMRAILAIDHVACQESALHGLGHWCRYYPQLVPEIIGEFRRASPAARPELLAYAASAERGCVL